MLEGEISQIHLIERLVELWREQFTGAIRFESDGIIKIVYFKGGDILSASTNDRADSVDEILMRAGKVSREHVKQALAKRKENETLGDALLNLGFITRKELTWARRVQVVGVIRSIAAWETGSFTIVADYLPKRDEGTLFPVPQVLVELIVTDQDRPKFERLMDGGTAVFAKAGDFDDVFRRLGLNDEAETIVRQIDGERSVGEVATLSGGETFNVYKLLHALATLGILTRVAAPEVTSDFSLDDFATPAAAAAADDFWQTSDADAATPMFELDEAEAVHQPTMEIRLPDRLPETPAPAAASAWDEEEEPELAATAEAKLPPWDVPPREPGVVPIPAPIEPAMDATEEQWGFDEAQLETARRAAAPPVEREQPVARGGRRYGLVVALIAIFLLSAAAYAGFLWWQKKQDEEAAASAPIVSRRAVPKPTPVAPAVVVPTTTTVALTETTTPTTTETATLASAPPPTAPAALPVVTRKAVTPAPMTISAPAPAPAPATTPASPLRDRYDSMAREYAANPAGNFTVQVQILCDPANLTKAINSGGENVWFLPQAIGSRSCYRVFWGHFATRDEAQQAMAAIPGDVRDPNAKVVGVPR